MPYKVLSPLNHDNTVYPIGSEIELEPAAAEALLMIGVVEPIEIPQAESVPPEAVPPKKKTDKDV